MIDIFVVGHIKVKITLVVTKSTKYSKQIGRKGLVSRFLLGNGNKVHLAYQNTSYVYSEFI